MSQRTVITRAKPTGSSVLTCDQRRAHEDVDHLGITGPEHRRAPIDEGVDERGRVGLTGQLEQLDLEAVVLRRLPRTRTTSWPPARSPTGESRHRARVELGRSHEVERDLVPPGNPTVLERLPGRLVELGPFEWSQAVVDRSPHELVTEPGPCPVGSQVR